MVGLLQLQGGGSATNVVDTLCPEDSRCLQLVDAGAGINAYADNAFTATQDIWVTSSVYFSALGNYFQYMTKEGVNLRGYIGLHNNGSVSYYDGSWHWSGGGYFTTGNVVSFMINSRCSDDKMDFWIDNSQNGTWIQVWDDVGLNGVCTNFDGFNIGCGDVCSTTAYIDSVMVANDDPRSYNSTFRSYRMNTTTVTNPRTILAYDNNTTSVDLYFGDPYLMVDKYVPTPYIISLNETIGVDIYAWDSLDHFQLSTFGANVSNSSEWIFDTTTTGTISFALGDVPTGSITIDVNSSTPNNYFTTSYSTTRNVTDTSSYNITMSKPFIILDTVDENTLADLYFNLTLTDLFSNSDSWNNITQLYENISSLSVGDFTTINVVGVSGSYPNRNYYTTIDTDSFINMTLYLLSLSDSSGCIVNFNVKNYLNNVLSGATVTIQRFISGSYTTIAQGITDSSGTVGFYLDPDVSYQVLISHPSYAASTITITPTVCNYYITLQASSIAQFSSWYGDISYKMSPVYNNLGKDEGQYINWTVYSPSGIIDWFNLNVVAQNGTQLFSQNVSTSSSGGTIPALLNLTNFTVNSKIIGYGTFYTSDFGAGGITRTFYIREYNPSNTTSILGFFDYIDTNSTMGNLGKFLIAVFVTILVVGGVAGFTGNIGIGVLFGIMIMLFFGIKGWIDISVLLIVALLAVMLLVARV